MMDLVELASTLFGSRRAESDSIPPDATVQMISASGAVDSVDGSAGVVMDCEITPADDTEGDESVLDIPTSPSVKTDDDLLVGLVGSGPLKTPVVLANPGYGDRLQSQMDTTEELVERAEAAANAVSQHFWSDDNGAHVTQVTQDEWSDPESSSYQSGPNSLWNVFGMLFRDGLTNLLAVLTNGIAIYDGNGNAAANILAEFTANLVRIGGQFASSGESSAGVQFFADDSSTSDLTASHYIDTEQDMQVYHNLMLDGTTTDAMLTGGTVTHSASGNLATYQEVYNDGSAWSEESDTGITAKTGDAQQVAKMGVNTLRSSTGTQKRRAYIQADTLRLTYGTGSSATVRDYPMSTVVAALTFYQQIDVWEDIPWSSFFKTLNSGWETSANTALAINRARRRIVGTIMVRGTATHAAGNNSFGYVADAYRPYKRCLIQSSTPLLSRMYVNPNGECFMVLPSQENGNVNHWLVADYMI